MDSVTAELLNPTQTVPFPTQYPTPGGIPEWTGRGGTGGGHNGGDDNGGEVLQEWSSLIGIITAIVGNVLIALALNVQRYAHTRLHKERIRVRRRAQAALKRAQSSNQSRTYGTLDEAQVIGYFGDQHNGNEIPNKKRNGVGNGSGTSTGSDGSHLSSRSNGDPNADHDYRESDPLAASFDSSTTTADADYDDESDLPKTSSNYLKSPYWWLGQILITVGEMGNFLAYGFAPASIVSPLGVVALVSNCIIAPAMFHEKFRARDFWGVVIAVSGVVTVVLSAKQEETKLNPHDVWGAITSTPFEIYLGVTTFLIITLMWASRKYGKRTILIDLGLVGLFGGYTALSTKGVSSMLSSTLWGAFTTPVTYVLIFILLVTAIMQIRYVNKALQRFDSTQVIPIQFVMFTLCVIIGSAVLYRDFEKTSVEQAIKFVGGCLLTFFGVFLITSGREHRDNEEDVLSEADGIEETIGLAQHDGSQQDRVVRKSPSRRSSRLSKVSFADTVKANSTREEEEEDYTQYRDNVESPPYLSGGADTLIGNPWQENLEIPVSPPRGIRTISTDSIFTRSILGFNPAQSSTGGHLRDSSAPPVYPTDRPVTPRANTSYAKLGTNPRSNPFISPSPLASTVTTVVKDAFLREDDNPEAPTSSIRRLRSSIRASLYFNDENNLYAPDVPEDAVSDGHLPRDLTTSGDVVGTSNLGRGRSRSLSDTIGEFFRPKRTRNMETPDTTNVDGTSRSP